MKYYGVEYKVRGINNFHLEDFKRTEVDADKLPEEEMYEFEHFDLYKVYFKTKVEQLQFILDELRKWS